MYNYVKSFLHARTASFRIPNHKSTPFVLTEGTPQGSVLSPTLFNIAMMNLPPLLDSIPNLKHSLYADDITLWTHSGSAADQEATLQAAADIIDTYTRSTGLSCSPHKSELLIVLNARSHLADRALIKVHVGGAPVPSKNQVKILGHIFQYNGKANHTVNKLVRQISPLVHIIRRTTGKHHGLKEQELLRLIDAVILSRMLYTIPYHSLTRTETRKLNTVLRKAYRLALAIPTYAPLHLIEATASFSRTDASIIRRAQTDTLPSTHFTHLFTQARGSPKCPHCGGYPNIPHTYWYCSHAPSPPSFPNPPPSWQEWLAPPPDRVEQFFEALVAHVKRVIEAEGLEKSSTPPLP
ncbi:hypothetical protein HPB47_013890 [Ixodes persulcatus]|uniref:Uncharacterized protein n=1 Tax=Ixodes persulcatus TaxID=34615 RepID=A0AC60QZY8_IXOPE|nr:hypothetical protein HPB47_013890 [Ixodes persulcatus]